MERGKDGHTGDVVVDRRISLGKGGRVWGSQERQLLGYRYEISCKVEGDRSPILSVFRKIEGSSGACDGDGYYTQLETAQEDNILYYSLTMRAHYY